MIHNLRRSVWINCQNSWRDCKMRKRQEKQKTVSESEIDTLLKDYKYCKY